MARIAISLCGEGRGHAARICTLVERLGGGNDFLIATTTEALEFLRGRCGGRGDVRFIELPGIRFRYVGDRLDVSRTVLDGLRFRALELPALVERMVRELDRFAPDLAITDFEPVLPRAASRLRVPLVSLDHQHFLVAYDVRVLPWHLRCTARLMGIAVRLFVPQAAATVVSAFFRPPLAAGWEHATQIGPLLRRSLLAAVPHDGCHLVSYLRQHTPPVVLDALAAAGVPVRVYGLGRRDPVGGVSFHDVDERRFIADLAGCRGVVAAAGNQLIGEAIHLGKPLLVLPERAHAEQTINAHFLTAEGCGEFVPLERVDTAAVRGFLDRRETFAAPLATRQGGMDGLPAAARAIATAIAPDAGLRHEEIRTAA
jgi:uncharacterized protein (TIGR00661 family)